MARLEQSELAQKAGVSVDTVKRLERMIGPVMATVSTLNSITSVLQAAGVIFVDENGEGPGVRLRKR